MKHLLAIAITLLPSAALAEQFTPQQLIEVMTKSPENRDVRMHDQGHGASPRITINYNIDANGILQASAGE